MSNYFAQRQAIKAFGQAAPVESKKAYVIPKQSEKKKQQLKDEKPERDELKAWFQARQKEMKGTCSECGGKINKADYPFAIMSIAHVLPKRGNQFPSIKTHKDNWIELCASNGCHHKYDTDWETASTMKIWPLVIEKFTTLYPSIAAKERRHIPDILLQEIEPSVILATEDEEGVLIIEKA